jgi:glycosyltransferase involved in cell wall biosynthesis
MKVLVATHSYAGNGAAVMLLAVMDYWIRELRWSVDALLPLDVDVPDDLARTGANLFPDANPRDYDFVLVNSIVSAQYVDRFAPLVRTVLWVHEGETVLLGSPATIAQWNMLFARPWKLVFQTSWQPDVVFRSLLLRTPLERIACVRNGLPPLPAEIVPAPRTPGKKRIVFIGGVYGRKRPQDLVDAVVALGRDDVECVFVGPTEQIDTIGAEQLALIRAHPDKFRLTGQLSRTDGLSMLASADVFCLPSGDESQPIAPLEAAALGIPCVLSDLAPYAGTWKHGVNCLLHPQADVPMLRWSLQTLLDDTKIVQSVAGCARDLPDRFRIGRFQRHFTAEMPQ